MTFNIENEDSVRFVSLRKELCHTCDEELNTVFIQNLRTGMLFKHVFGGAAIERKSVIRDKDGADCAVSTTQITCQECLTKYVHAPQSVWKEIEDWGYTAEMSESDFYLSMHVTPPDSTTLRKLASDAGVDGPATFVRDVINSLLKDHT